MLQARECYTSSKKEIKKASQKLKSSYKERNIKVGRKASYLPDKLAISKQKGGAKWKVKTRTITTPKHPLGFILPTAGSPRGIDLAIKQVKTKTLKGGTNDSRYPYNKTERDVHRWIGRSPLEKAERYHPRQRRPPMPMLWKNRLSSRTSSTVPPAQAFGRMAEALGI